VRHFEQLLRITQVGVERSDGRDDAVEQLLFPAKRLRVLGVVPDVRVFEFLVDFG
jgi:hypothetical protein